MRHVRPDGRVNLGSAVLGGEVNDETLVQGDG